ncbi:hypothetical protein BB561_004003 [Smittium simulii]|uniref:rRNA methyltransferase 2, mitochondrial n=1 Tax=Smittium simulii TaxID=133385 RepID=A0A2T9YIQ3_9FUNG|nr:hypothetical protein BB561_004003 [Smittium simulii]
MYSDYKKKLKSYDQDINKNIPQERVIGARLGTDDRAFYKAIILDVNWSSYYMFNTYYRLSKDSVSKATKVSEKSTKAKKKSSARYIARQNSDHYVSLAKEHGYRARSSFKLLELDKKYNLLDSFRINSTNNSYCGCAPGGWSQVLSEVLYTNNSPKSPKNQADHKQSINTDKNLVNCDISKEPKTHIEERIIAIDLLPIVPIKGVKFILGDFLKQDTHQVIDNYISGNNVSLILSDMSPNLSGNKTIDNAKSLPLCLGVLELAKKYLAKDGSLVMKYFMGENHIELKKQLSTMFKKVKSDKLQSSRKESAEQYFVCSGFLAENKK